MLPVSRIDDHASPRVRKIAVLVLVALPILLNAIALFPEVTNTAPSDNDQIFHYLFIERANQALAAGDNPFDHWLPEVEAGFPQFLYYQNLPHLTVVAIHHLLLQRVSLLTVLNLIRYLLMVLFPLTVYWSMRRMEFSMIAAAVGAAFSSTLCSRAEYGFDYHSYIWLGNGMFPQLCSMHLMFIATACMYSVLARSRGYAAAILSSSAIVLSDLLYGYIFATAALLLWILSVWKVIASADDSADRSRRIWRLTARFALVGAVALLITAYQTVPFIHQVQYINRESAGGLGHVSMEFSAALGSLFAGHLFDDHRLPIVSALVLLGIVYGAVRRGQDAKIALTFFVVFLFLAFGRSAFASLFALFPAAHLVPFMRFIAGSDLSAILLAGLGGELIWNWWPWNFFQSRTIAPLALLLVLCALALANRWNVYQNSQEQMQVATEAMQDDVELAEIFSTLRASPPGRVFAGSRGNWGSWMRAGRAHLYDLLPIEQFDTVMPWQSLSLNSPYLWRINLPDQVLCQLYNIRYVIAPPSLRVPKTYRRMLTTSRYILYDTGSAGYMQLGQIDEVITTTSGSTMYARNKDWIASPEVAHAGFIAFVSGPHKSAVALTVAPGSTPDADNSTGLGTIENETVTPDSLSALVTAASPALLVVKTSYHPNWHVLVDGRPQHAFMVSPSFIGTLLTPGRHEIKVEYRSSEMKKLLMLLSGLTLLATIAIRVFNLEPFLFGSFAD